MNETDVQTDANHINLFITSMTCLADFVSAQTNVIWTTTMAKEVNSAIALKRKKILNEV